MADAFTNFAKSTLVGGLAPATTTLTVQAGDGVLFPVAGAGQTFRFVLQNAANQKEVCICTLRTGDVFNTITRNAEGTTALTWNAGDRVGHRLTAAQLNNILVSSDLQQNTKTWCGTAGGTVNALTLTPTPAVTVMVAGHKFIFKTSGANTTPATVSVSGLATFALQNNGVALIAGDLEGSKWYEVLYDGAAGQLKKFALGVPSILTAKGDLVSFDGTAYARVGVGTDNQALLADSSTASGLRYVSLGSGATRQSVLQGVQDASGYANILTTGAGLRPGLSATAKACIIAFSAGFGQAGALDLTSTISADVADILGANLPLSNTSFVHATYTSPAAVTWGSGLVPPDYGYAFDRSRAALLNFEGINAAVTTTDDFGNTWTLNNGAHIDTAQKQFGTSSSNYDGINDYAETTNITSLGDGSWEVSMWVRWSALPGVGATQFFWAVGNAASFGAAMFINNTAGTTKVGIYASSDGTSWNVASAVLGANTVWAINTWYKFRYVFDSLAGTYRLYLSVAGAAETQDISVASALKVCGAFTFMRIGCQLTGASLLAGWVDAFRFLRAATNTTTETPSVVAPAIGDHPHHWYSLPDAKMYEATVASAVAGTNPTFTARNRCYVGEADTSGAAVTAVRSYALRGQYSSGQVGPLPAASTQTSKNHNIGTKLCVGRLTITNTTSENGYVVGDKSDPITCDATPFSWPHSIGITRNSASFGTSTTAWRTGQKAGGGITAPLTIANWSYELTVQRSF